MSDVIKSGEQLDVDERLVAPNGRSFMIMQGDGNLVVYEVHRGRNIPVWASNTPGSGGTVAALQTDGNLVVYRGDGHPVWASHTAGQGEVHLRMQDDGNAVVYRVGGGPVWASGTVRQSRVLAFDPARDAFRFPNSFVNQVATIPGAGTITTQGRCGGMAFAALDYFLSGVPVPRWSSRLFGGRGVPPDGHWLADYIYWRLMNSFAAPSSFKYVEWTLKPDHSTWLGGKGVTRWTKEDEFPRLRAMIDAGQPAALGLIDATSLADIGNENHQVIAYGYEWHPQAGTMTVLIQDNNNPGRGDTLRTEPGNPHWDASNTDPWRGWFVIDYVRSNPPVYTRNPAPAGAVVRYGQVVKLSHVWSGRTLHSHALSYGHVGGSGQQQVTCFEGADDNDLWRIRPAHGVADASRAGQTVSHGDTIRLEHVLTRRNLHSHAGLRSPVTGQQEVTCFGENGTGDGNDDWHIEVDGSGTWTSDTRFRLVHVPTNHALHSHVGYRHWQWTAGQQEVTGFQSRDDNDWWWLLETR